MTTFVEMASPRLTFACELEPEPLAALFDTPRVVDTLLALGATVSLGLMDLSDARAAVVRRLNEAGVLLTAWLLLPKEEGYWLHAGNVERAVARFDAFERWTTEHGLRWAGLGLDVEPDYVEMQQFLGGGAGRLLPRLAGRVFSGAQVARAEETYAGLVARAHAAGYATESYHLPLVVDDRQGARILHRVLQLVDLPVQREILMLYTSFFRGLGPGLLWSYAPQAGGIGLGSTGGGVDIAGHPPPLTWEALARDLRLARRWTDRLFVFSLEGCVEQGYLARLVDFDWGAPVDPPLAGARRVDRLRRLLRGALWASSHPSWVLGLGVTAWLLSRLLPWRAQRNDSQ